jgi:hypothetical protein
MKKLTPSESSAPVLTAGDREQLESHGVPVEEALRQIDMLRHPPALISLDRACTVGDGIARVPESEHEPLHRLHDEAARSGRCLWFVPASGAASRMFKELLAVLASEKPPRAKSPEAEALELFMRGLPRFAFHRQLAGAVAHAGLDLAVLEERGDHRAILSALITPLGLDYEDLPKGLMPFHTYGDEVRTACEEQLVEASHVAQDIAKVCRAHFTVSTDQLTQFRELLERVHGTYETRLGVRLDVGFSTQNPATDTLALDASGQPFRTDDGKLLLRPAGHGALIENLGATRGDIVFIKNVDNVAIDGMKTATYAWSRALIGMLVRAQRTVFELLRRLAEPSDAAAVDEALTFARSTLHCGPRATIAAIEQRRVLAQNLLDRPLRVCGVVPIGDEPGGGPFFVRGGHGELSLQIVEGAQLDPKSKAQGKLVAGATHFNPVFMACALRNHRGEAFDLATFVDPDAVIIATKSYAGRELTTLERPGLWNGGMAHWNTIFVEVPGAVFNPVKTVNDLLRAEHQGVG